MRTQTPYQTLLDALEWAVSDLHAGDRDVDLEKVLGFVRSSMDPTLRVGDSITCCRFLAETASDPMWTELLNWIFTEGLNLPGNHDRKLAGAQVLRYLKEQFVILKDDQGRRVAFIHANQFDWFWQDRGPLKKLRTVLGEEVLERAWFMDQKHPGQDEALSRLIGRIIPPGYKQDPERAANKAAEWGRGVGVDRVITAHTHRFGVWRRSGCDVFNLGSGKKGTRMGVYRIKTGILYEYDGKALVEVAA